MKGYKMLDRFFRNDKQLINENKLLKKMVQSQAFEIKRLREKRVRNLRSAEKKGKT